MTKGPFVDVPPWSRESGSTVRNALEAFRACRTHRTPCPSPTRDGPYSTAGRVDASTPWTSVLPEGESARDVRDRVDRVRWVGAGVPARVARVPGQVPVVPVLRAVHRGPAPHRPAMTTPGRQNRRELPIG